MDKSGNRRFLPVEVHPEDADCHILDDEKASRAYIEQLWAEVMEIYLSGDYSLVLPDDLQDELLRLSKEPATQYEMDRIRNAVIAAIKEIKDTIDSEVVDVKKKREILDKQVMNKVKLEVKKIDWGRRLPEKQRQKKIVEAIKTGMALDPDMTPEMIEDYTPAIEQIVRTHAKYGK